MEAGVRSSAGWWAVRPEFALIHKCGCGKPAFLRDTKPLLSDPVSERGCFHLDGAPVRYGDPLVCESCGEDLEIGDLIADWFEPIALSKR